MRIDIWMWVDLCEYMDRHIQMHMYAHACRNLVGCVIASGAVLAITAEPSVEMMNEIEQFCSAETELSERIVKEIIFQPSGIEPRLLEDC